jgi:hypothetical protein
MSYDLMVFEPTAAPADREGFLAWFAAQIEWGEEHDYDDPRVSSPALRAWFQAAIATFPPANGPYASASDAQEENLMTADYSVGREVIYVAFAWSKAQQAYDLVRSLAAQAGVGFFDVSSSQGEVWLPDGSGTLHLHHRDENAGRQQAKREAQLKEQAARQAANLGKIIAGRAGLGEAEAAVWLREALTELGGMAPTSNVVPTDFTLTLASLERGLRTVGYREPRKLAEAALSAAATAVLGRATEFVDGKLIEFRRVVKDQASSPDEIGLEEARAIDPSFSPGEECGFSVDWDDWLLPILNWLFTRAPGSSLAD